MFRFDVFTVKGLALLMSVLVLALAIGKAMPPLMQTGMALSGSTFHASAQLDQIDQSMDHASMDHASMDHTLTKMTVDKGCATAGACCLDSCSQVGLAGAVLTDSLASTQFSSLPTRNKASRSLGAIYRPPRLTA